VPLTRVVSARQELMDRNIKRCTVSVYSIVGGSRAANMRGTTTSKILGKTYENSIAFRTSVAAAWC
jgi:hypothetical protein